MPSLHILHLVLDPVAVQLRQLNDDCPPEPILVALDPRAEDQVHVRGVVPSELNRHVLMVPHDAIPPEPHGEILVDVLRLGLLNLVISSLYRVSKISI